MLFFHWKTWPYSDNLGRKDLFVFKRYVLEALGMLYLGVKYTLVVMCSIWMDTVIGMTVRLSNKTLVLPDF